MVAEENAADPIVALFRQMVEFAFGQRTPVEFVDARVRNQAPVPVSLEDGTFSARRPTVHVDLFHVGIGIQRGVNGRLGVGWVSLAREQERVIPENYDSCERGGERETREERREKREERRS